MSSHLDLPRLANAYDTAVRTLIDECEPSGHWIGELSTSALSTATAVSALATVCRARESKPNRSNEENAQTERFRAMIDGGITWLSRHQNDDGGWGDTDLSYSNIATTMLVLAAFRLAEQEETHCSMIDRGEAYVSRLGGIEGLRKRYGKDKTFAVPILSNCAIAGIVDWSEVAPLPFEAAWVPQSLYRWMQMPVVSYAIPALVAIGQARFFHKPPRNPLSRAIRKMAVSPTLQVLKRMQPSSGGFLEAIPLTSFVVMGLASSGRDQHDVVTNGLRFIEESIRPDGSWPIDTNLATWTTTLSVVALASGVSTESNPSETAFGELTAETRQRVISVLERPELLEWILSCQNLEKHPFTGAKPGGWGWTDLSGAVPDADDTPGALLALSELMRLGIVDRLDQRTRVTIAAHAGIEWLLGLQNRDGGWPTFCRGWGKLPFDRSGSDLTAHVLRAFRAWESMGAIEEAMIRRMKKAASRGEAYLKKHQQNDGSWLPLWFGNQDQPDEINPIYGSAKVLAAYAELGLVETEACERGLKWLREQQNADRGWGGGDAIASSFGRRTSLACQEVKTSVQPAAKRDLDQSSSETTISSVEETALAIDALVVAGEPEVVFSEGLADGVNWLVDRVEADQHRSCSPIGFYFAKLWYYERLYPSIFTAAAVGKVIRAVGLVERKNALTPVPPDPINSHDSTEDIRHDDVLSVASGGLPEES